jgi:N-acetylmuramoyl-L-alanine amidase
LYGVFSFFPLGQFKEVKVRKNKMKIAIDAGHNCQCDRGALGINRSEDLLTKELANNLIKLLKAENHDCILVTPSIATSTSDSLAKRVTLANNQRCDLYISLHFNALNHAAFGSEIYAIGEQGQKIAHRVLAEIAKLGFFNRGVKNRNFYVLKHTKMPAILVECCFCDNSADMARYNSGNMAIAIKNGILNKVGAYDRLENKQFLQVQHDTIIKPSTEQLANLPSLDLPKIAKGTYTIIHHEPEEEGHFWVELKSGLKGFIYAGHATISSSGGYFKG